MQSKLISGLFSWKRLFENYYGLNFMPRGVLLDYRSPGIDQATAPHPRIPAGAGCVAAWTRPTGRSGLMVGKKQLNVAS